MLDERTLLLSSGESMSAVHILLFVVASLTLLNLSAWACYPKPTHAARRQAALQPQFPGLCLKTQLPSLHFTSVVSILNLKQTLFYVKQVGWDRSRTSGDSKKVAEI